ncbi:MucBP domain-containing protein [Enterococcus alishanensis]
MNLKRKIPFFLLGLVAMFGITMYTGGAKVHASTDADKAQYNAAMHKGTLQATGDTTVSFIKQDGSVIGWDNPLLKSDSNSLGVQAKFDLNNIDGIIQAVSTGQISTISPLEQTFIGQFKSAALISGSFDLNIDLNSALSNYFSLNQNTINQLQTTTDFNSLLFDGEEAAAYSNIFEIKSVTSANNILKISVSVKPNVTGQNILDLQNKFGTLNFSFKNLLVMKDSTWDDVNQINKGEFDRLLTVSSPSGETTFIVSVPDALLPYASLAGITVTNPYVGINLETNPGYGKLSLGYVMVYDGNGNSSGTAPVDSDSPYDGEKSIVLKDQNDMKKDNAKFIGWSTDQNYVAGTSPLYNAGDKYTIAKNTILYAVWKDIVQGGNVTVSYVDESGNKLQEKDTVLEGEVDEDYTTVQKDFYGYRFKEVVGNANGKFTSSPQQVTYVYSKIVPGKLTVEYWEYDTKGNAVKKLDERTITGEYGDYYNAEILYLTGYGFNGVVTDTEAGYAPAAGRLLDEEDRTIKLTYHKLAGESTEGMVLVQYQDVDGNEIKSSYIERGEIGKPYTTKKEDIVGYKFKEVIGNATGTFTNAVPIVTYVYQKDSVVPKDVLVPVYRAYNPNDGDHLFTTSKDEYNWIQDQKWSGEGTAFQSVKATYADAVKVYRLYNVNSGEHFYTTSLSEYETVAAAGWKKEGTSFYMVPKEQGNPIYRVFNPNATGPGSHMYTASKIEADWLISLGWRDEGIAFYTPK